MRQKSSQKSRASKSVEFAALESRVLFCGYHTAAGQIVSEFPAIQALGNNSQPSNNNGGLHSTSGLNVPVLNSLPGAKGTIFLDFDGDAARQWGSYTVPTTGAYNIDGDASSFSATEIARISEIWQRVAEKFSIFNINVTTVDPGTYLNGKALQVVIGGDGAWFGSAGGLSYINSFSNTSPNTVYAFSENLGNGYAKYVAEAISHETGHAFGLQHQSSYNGTTQTSEYNPGDGASAPTMGSSYAADRGIWWYGTSSINGTMQDDLSIITSSANGFGYRGDDFGSAPSTAKNVKWGASSKFLMKATITSVNDKDFFKFAFNGGTLTLKLRSQGAGAMLDGKLRLYRSDGTILANMDNSNLSETIVRTLPPGTYYAAVFSHGGYGDIGQYSLYGYDDVLGAAPTPGTTPGATPASPAPSQSVMKVASIFSSNPIAKSLAAEVEADLMAA